MASIFSRFLMLFLVSDLILIVLIGLFLTCITLYTLFTEDQKGIQVNSRFSEK